MDKNKTNTTKTVRLSGVTEYHPEKPVMFDPPKLMYVWDEDDVACGDEGDAPYLASVLYVNPQMAGNGVLAQGDGSSAKNFGTTWDHCALIEECKNAPSFGADVSIGGTAAPYWYGFFKDGDKPSHNENKRDNSDPHYRSIDHIPLAVYEYLQSSDACRVSNDKIVTHRELSEWVAEGKGEVLYCERRKGRIYSTYSNAIAYNPENSDVPVTWKGTAIGECTFYMVRKYGDKQPAHPTYKYMGLATEETPETMPAPEKKMATLSNVVYWLSEQLRPCGITIAYGDSEVVLTGDGPHETGRIHLSPVYCEFLPRVAEGTCELSWPLYVPNDKNEGCLLYNPVMDMASYVKTMNRLLLVNILNEHIKQQVTAPKVKSWEDYTK